MMIYFPLKPPQCIKTSEGLSVHHLTGKVCPVTAYDKDGVRVLLHFATECPPGRPDVLVIVVSMLNTAPLPVSSVVLQAAVPKVERHLLPSPQDISSNLI